MEKQVEHPIHIVFSAECVVYSFAFCLGMSHERGIATKSAVCVHATRYPGAGK